ncbi:MAG TPA: hypothetical protein VNQ90_17845 [Chthoniobacteraceae bacterium]|nr:hypothetical protein [Chthoniobacteraceae bacterium]
MKASLLRLLALVVSLGTCFATTAQSQILISRSSAAPLESHSAVRIKVPEEITGTQYQMKWWDTRDDKRANRRRETGQIFSLSGTDPVAIEGFAFRLNLGTADFDGNQQAKATGQAVTLSIYQATGTSNPTPVGAALYTGTGTLPAGMLARDYLTFTLPEAFEATPGTLYSVQIAFNTYGGGNQITLATGSGSLYDGGTGFWYANLADSDTMDYDVRDRDLDFAVLYTPAPIPEASTLGLLLTSGLLLLAFHFNRRRTQTIL